MIFKKISGQENFQIEKKYKDNHYGYKWKTDKTAIFNSGILMLKCQINIESTRVSKISDIYSLDSRLRSPGDVKLQTENSVKSMGTKISETFCNSFL